METAPAKILLGGEEEQRHIAMERYRHESAPLGCENPLYLDAMRGRIADRSHQRWPVSKLDDRQGRIYLFFFSFSFFPRFCRERKILLRPFPFALDIVYIVGWVDDNNVLVTG